MDLTQDAARQPATASKQRCGDQWVRFWSYSLMEKAESLQERYWLLKTQLYYRRFFGQIGHASKLLNPLRLKGVKHIYIENNVTINKHAFLLTVSLDDGRIPRLVIGEGSVIGHRNHITCVNELVLGKKVLTADGVHLSDNSHGFSDPTVPILDQGIKTKGSVSIGDGTWIGENASVLSCSIGRNCVIGANAVVVTDIPDYSIAVGVPARIVKRFCLTSGTWKKVDNPNVMSERTVCANSHAHTMGSLPVETALCTSET